MTDSVVSAKRHLTPWDATGQMASSAVSWCLLANTDAICHLNISPALAYGKSETEGYHTEGSGAPMILLIWGTCAPAAGWKVTQIPTKANERHQMEIEVICWGREDGLLCLKGNR